MIILGQSEARMLEKTREYTYRPDVIAAQCVSIAVTTTGIPPSPVLGEAGGDGGSDGRQSNSEEDGNVDKHEVSYLSRRGSVGPKCRSSRAPSVVMEA